MKLSFFDRRSFLIILVMVFLAPLLVRGSRLALSTNRNDVKDWLPDHFEETKIHDWFEGFFPHEQFVLVSWKGRGPDDPGCTLGDERLEMLARKLEDYDPTLEELGITGKLAELLEANQLGTRRQIRQHVSQHVSQRGNLASIEGISPEQAAELTERVDAWASPFKTPIRTGTRLVQELEDRCEDLSHQEIIERLQGSLIGRPDPHADPSDDDSYTTCLVVVLSEAARGKKLRPTLEIIRQVAQQQCAIRPEDLRMGGPPVSNVAIDVEGERTISRLVGLSAVIGLGMAWLCFRSFRLTFLVFLVAVLAAMLGLASVYGVRVIGVLLGGEWIKSSYGTCDAILLTMPTLLYVLAISGAVHIINYYHDAVRDHGLLRAPERALAHGMLPCTLAAVTTALGLGSLMASHLVPISKFGLYSVWGVLATLALLFLFLPACLHYFPSRQYVLGGAKNPNGQATPSVLGRFWHGVGGFIARYNVPVTAGCLLVMVVFLVGLTRVGTSVKLMKLYHPKAEIVTHYRWLEEHLGPLVPMEVVLRVDNTKCRLNMVQRMRMARDVEEAIETQLDDVGGALSAATFAPMIGKTSSNAAARLGYSSRDRVTSKQLERFRDAMHEYLQVDDGQELWRVGARAYALTDLDYSEFVDSLKRKVEKVLDDNYRELSPEERQAGIKPVEGVEAVYTGLVPLVYKAQNELLAGLFNSLKWAFVLIAVVMVLILRSPTAGLLSMLPNVFPVVFIFGAMGWMGIPVDIGTMMTASVALGVAVDDTIHFLTWFRRGLDEGRHRKQAVMLAYERCGAAMTQTTLIGGLGLSVFALSTFTPTQRFGMLMLTLLAAALAGDLIFLPALLCGPIGRCFRVRSKKPSSGQAAHPGVRIDDGDEEPPPTARSARDSEGQVIAVPITRPTHRNIASRSSRAS